MAFVDGQDGFDAGPTGYSAAGEQDEDAGVRRQKPKWTPPPRKADEHGAQHIDGQRDIQRGEPVGAIDQGSGHRGAVFSAVVTLDQRRRGQHDGVDRDQRCGELQRCEGAERKAEGGWQREEGGRWGFGGGNICQRTIVSLILHP